MCNLDILWYPEFTKPLQQRLFHDVQVLQDNLDHINHWEKLNNMSLWKQHRSEEKLTVFHFRNALCNTANWPMQMNWGHHAGQCHFYSTSWDGLQKSKAEILMNSKNLQHIKQVSAPYVQHTCSATCWLLLPALDSHGRSRTVKARGCPENIYFKIPALKYLTYWEEWNIIK